MKIGEAVLEAHGAVSIGTLRALYGPDFAGGADDSDSLLAAWSGLGEKDVATLVHDHEADTLGWRVYNREPG